MDKRKNSTDSSRDWFINVPFDFYQSQFDSANFWHPYRKPPNLNGIRLWAPYQRLKVEEEANPIGNQPHATYNDACRTNRIKEKKKWHFHKVSSI
jgi:hypothetical protein